MGLDWLRPYVMLVRFNMMMELTNVIKKKKKTIECDKSTVMGDVGTA